MTSAASHTFQLGCELCVHLIVEPVLVSQRAQVVQPQRVFLVDHLKGGHRFHNDRSAVSVHLREDGIFAASWGEENSQMEVNVSSKCRFPPNQPVAEISVKLPPQVF